jgi:excisionase family DNA binding protein
MQSNADFLTVDEAARLTGFSHWSIRRWLSASPPKLTRYKIGTRTVINREELLELLKPIRAPDAIERSE